MSSAPRITTRRPTPARTRPCCAVALFAALSCSATLARQSDVPAQLTQLAQLEIQLAAPALDLKARTEIAAQADALRAKLIAAAPEDERVPTWLTDRAAFALDQSVSTGLDLVILYGLPTMQQTDQVRPSAERAAELCTLADQAAAKAVAKLEARLLDRAAAPNAAVIADIEARLNRLVDTEQARRIPTLRALARTLVAATTPDPQRAAPIAQDALRDLKSLPADPSTSRNIAFGAALIHAAYGEHSAEYLHSAGTQFAQAFAESQASPDSPTYIRARLGLARTGRERPASANTNPELAALEAEAAAAWHVDRSQRDLAERTPHIAEAVRLLASAMPTPAQIAAGAPDRRALMCEKIAAIVPKTIPLSALPAEAAFAKGVVTARAATKPEDNKYREAAAGLFTLAADRTEAPPTLRSQARWERAVVIGQTGDELAEFDAIVRVFGEDNTCEQAVPAAKRVVDTFNRKQAAAGGIALLSETWRIRAGALREAVNLLLLREPGDIWHTEAIRIVCADIAGPALPASQPPMAALERATRLLTEMESDEHRHAAQSLVADALMRHLDQRRAAASTAPITPSSPANKSPWAELVPLATEALAWSRTHDAQRESAYTLILGESLAFSANASALEVLSPLSGTPIDRADSPLYIRFRFALSRAQRTAGDNTKAFTILREVSEQLDVAPGATKRDPAFWAAWAEMLRILQAMNTDGSRTADIRVQVQRLELLDPALGGPPHAEVIRQIRKSLAP